MTKKPKGDCDCIVYFLNLGLGRGMSEMTKKPKGDCDRQPDCVAFGIVGK